MAALDNSNSNRGLGCSGEAVLAVLVLARAPSAVETAKAQLQIERAEAWQPWDVALGIAWRVVAIGVGLTLLLGLAATIRAGVHKLDLTARLIWPDPQTGQFPAVKVRRGEALVDLNRSPDGKVMTGVVGGKTGLLLVLLFRYVFGKELPELTEQPAILITPPDTSAAQMQVTGQAQAVQALAAASRGAPMQQAVQAAQALLPLRPAERVGWAPWPEQRAFAFVLDTGTLPVSIERLCDEKVVHQVSTALGGRRVEVVNHRGVMWIVGMDLPPLAEPKRRRLPKVVELDLGQRPPDEYSVGLGLGRDGPVWLRLEEACRLMVGGSSNSGKSAFLRSLLYQLMVAPAPVEVLLADLEGRTCSAFEGLPRLRFPVAEDVDSATRLTAWLMDEMERRGRLFDSTGYHPEKLSEYHQVPGVERLPWIVAVFDEFTALLDAAGQRSELYRHVGQLAMRSRKYGVTLIFAGQDFKSDLVNSRITNQVRTRVAHRCATRQQSESILGQAGAEQLTVCDRHITQCDPQRDHWLITTGPESATLGPRR